MKKTIKLTKQETRSIRMKKWGSALGTFLMRNASCIACVLAMCMMCTPAVHASGAAPADADSAWTLFIDFVTKWILRLGGLSIGIGAVLFGTGWHSDDAPRKTVGLNTALGGGIVMAAAGFLKIVAV